MKLLLFSCLSLCVFAQSRPDVTLKQQGEGDEDLPAYLRDLDMIEDEPAQLNRNVKQQDEDDVLPPYLRKDLDMIEDEAAQLNRRVKRQMPTSVKKWPNSTVQFFFDPYVPISQRNRASVLNAQKYIQSRTCVNFVENPNFDPVKINLRNAPNIITVYKGKDCSSGLGMKGGIQGLSLDDGCELMGVIAHEFIHALGVMHMQQRSDRDDYVFINTSAIQKDKLGGNFDKEPIGGDYIKTPYDYGSVMHYGADNFIKQNGTLSIIPKDKRYLYTMGNNLISFYDIQMINAFYGCDAMCTARNSAKCKNGGVPNPRNCAECNCPRGYGGPLCDQRPAGCGSTLKATSEWQREYVEAKSYRAQQDEYNQCNHWITAPAGKQIELNFLYLSYIQCNYGCQTNGIEVKTNPDPRVTNPLFCCKEFFNKVIRSPLNPTPVISFNANSYPYTVFEYRYVDGAVKPTTKTTTTTTTTTPPPPPPRNCRDTMDSCEELEAWGHCSNVPFRMAKYTCAVTCGLCGKSASPCVDSPKCPSLMAKGGCTSVDPMRAELDCAQTCGYCQYPN